MRNFFNLDSPIMQKVSLFGTLIMMNLLWLVCCIPVVTIGASTTAMFRVMFDLRKNKSVRIAGFFRFFRDNFKRSSLIWLIYLLGAAVLYVLYWFVSWVDVGSWARALLLIPFLLVFFVWFFSLHYCFALCAFFDNSLEKTLTNAIAISVRHMRQTIFCAALTLLPLVFGMISPEWLLRLSYAWIFIYPALSFYWKSKLIGNVFAGYAPSPDVNDQCDKEDSQAD